MCVLVCVCSYQMMSTVGRRKQVQRVKEHDDGFLSSSTPQQFLKVRTEWRQLQEMKTLQTIGFLLEKNYTIIKKEIKIKKKQYFPKS